MLNKEDSSAYHDKMNAESKTENEEIDLKMMHLF